MKQQHKKLKIQAKNSPKLQHQPIKVEQKSKNKVNNNNANNNNNKGIENLPTIQNMLEIPKEQRNKRVKELFQKVKPFIASYMIKKQGSRVLQLFYKWGSEDIKASIFQAIVKNWKQLIKSKYALYTISKVSVDHDIPNLINDVLILQNNSQGAVTIENYIAKDPESQGAKSLYHKIESVAANTLQQQTTTNQQTLHNLAIKSIQKGYYNLRLSKLILRLTLPNLFEAQRIKTIQFLIQNFSNILDEQQGIKLFIELVNNCNTKQKKQLVKNFKNHLKEILNASNVSYIAILKLFTEVDDTVSIGRKLVPELLEILPEIQENKKLYNVLLSLMSERTNNFNCLGKFQPEVYHTQCKKSEEVRWKAVRQYIYQDLVAFLLGGEVLEATCRNKNLSKVVLGTIKSMQKDGLRDQLQKLSMGIFEHMIGDLQQKLKTHNIQQSFICDTFGSKLLKNIIFTTANFQLCTPQCQQLQKLFASNIKTILENKSTFVLSALIEKGDHQTLLPIIKNSGVNFNKVLIGKFYQDQIKGVK